MILESVCVGSLETNCYVLASRQDSPAMIIDPGAEKSKIERVLNKHRLKPGFIINTHGHYDHIGCDDNFGVPVYIHRQDLALLKNAQQNFSVMLGIPYSVKSEIRILEEADFIRLEDLELEVIHTPGHTPGGICLLMKKPTNRILFTGDTLFCQGIGRTDFPGADQDSLIKNIRDKLFHLPEDTVIYPGHGPSSTIGQEKKDNPFIN